MVEVVARLEELPIVDEHDVVGGVGPVEVRWTKR